MMKGNLRLDALCSFRKFSTSDMTLFLMNSREKNLGDKKIGII
jgi:hypothetical protein